MTRNELKIVFEFMSDSLDNIYADTVGLDVVQDTTHDFPAVKQKILDNILTLADFAYYFTERLESSEEITC